VAGPRLAELVARIVRDLASPLGEPTRLTGLRGSASALLLARFHTAHPRPIVVLAADAAAAEAFATDVTFYRGDRPALGPLERRVHVLPGWEVPPFESISPARETVAARMEGLYHLHQTPDPVIVTTVEAWGQRGLPRDVFAEAVTYVVAGETVAPDALVERLVRWGYHRVPLVQDPGDLAIRGGILDVYPAGYTTALRFEFFGDDVETIRRLDTTSQRSLDALEEALLLPLREFGQDRLGPGVARAIDTRAADVALARSERRDLVEAVKSGLVLPGMEALLPYLYEPLGALADYLPANTLVWAEQASGLETAAEAGWQQIEAHAAAADTEGRFHPEPAMLYLPPAEWRTRLQGRPRVEIEGLESLAGDDVRATTYATDTIAPRATAAGESPLVGVAKRLHEWEGEGTRLVFVASSASHRARLSALLEPHGFAVLQTDAPFGQAITASGRGPLALVGDLSRGARLPADGLAMVTEAEIFGEQRQIRRGRRERPVDVFSALSSTAFRSQGISVRRSRISTETPSPSSSFAASSAVCTIAPQVTTVTSSPSRCTRALPNGTV